MAFFISMIKQRIQGLIIAFFYQIYASTFRYNLMFEDESDKKMFFNDVFGKRPHDNNFVYAFYHQAQVGLVSYFSRKNLTVMVSPSRDGEILATILNHLGMRLIRGSSSKKSKNALRESFEEVKNGYSLGLAVDGPRGPAFKPKYGICKISKEINKMIVPVSIKASKYKLVNSWDKSIIPMPFSKIDIIIGKISFYEIDELEKSLNKHISNT